MTPAQIKFRGFRTDGKGWVEGSLTIEPNNVYKIEWWEETKTEGLKWFEHQIHPSSLGMFTGLCDKNGKEIFGAIGEMGGDRISFGRGLTYFVKFINGNFQVLHEIHKEIDYTPLRWGLLYRVVELQWDGYLEIIGNQWEEQDYGKV